MTLHVLLADDEAGMRTVLELHMKRRGWEVVAVRDGEEALTAALADGYDVLVLDQLMPGRTGLEVARALATEVPIIIFSAYLDDDLKQQAHDLGCHTVSKANLTELLDRIQELAAA